MVGYAPLDPSLAGVDLNLDCDTEDIGIAVDLTFLERSGLPGSVEPSPGQTLHGHDDWSNIVMPISDGGGDFAGAPPEDELTDEQRDFIRDNFPIPPGVCEADWNDDDAVNTLDFLAYLNDWTAMEHRADLNLDDVVNTLDFLEFLNLWVNGC